MRRLALILWCLLAVPVAAVEPHEMLDDPVLEARAQELDHLLRCVQCRSESIASSNAGWAADARVLVRSLIAEGKSNQDVLDFFVARYGDVVLMRPRTGGANILLWLAGPALFLVGGGVAAIYLRRRASPQAPEALSEDERRRLDELMRD